MSNTQTYEPVNVSADGITVVKRFEADEFPVPAIAFNITSQRTEPVTVTLTDDVPGDVTVEDLGFHPEYGSEHWTIDEDTISFEREIDADSAYTTVYGIRATGTDDVEKFLTEPTIESVDPPMEAEEDLVEDASSDVVRDVIAGESDSVPGLDDADDEEIETLDLADPNTDRAGSEGAESDGDGTIDGVQPGSVAKTLAAEIRQDAVDDATLAVLEDELDLGGAGGSAGNTSGAVDARIQQLQNDVSDLTAYTSALEEFLDENGQGEELIADFRDRLESFEGNLSSVQNELEAIEGEVGSVQETVSSHSETVDDLESTVADLESEIEAVSEQVGDTGEIDDRLEDIEATIQDLEAWREQLSSVIGGAE
ncbi:hypothetical protein Hrd1104_06495 [Halorhabdus sp. CBA1104]|uniref:hypothetical protein n=1 Tax=Halorhabdus sp. CBA1104 TaxID=1380432 RepID=UPI0012B1BACB|nr:hypothetical protein [Halorhabdus sp. CBA1104]QGN06977.1 hypothetical protein Hrd1104_06495 [Halorhabdus sp. CBA1104]